MATLDDFYARIGEVAVKFAWMEFLVGEIVSRLIGKGNPVIGPIVVENRSLAEKTRLLKKLAAFRYIRNEGMEQAATGLAAEVEKFREKRNPFVHGLWDVCNTGVADGKLPCLDMKWKIKTEKKHKKHCSRAAETVWSLQELHVLATEVDALCGRLLAFKHRMAKEKMDEMDIGNVPFELVKTHSSPRKKP